MTMLCEHYSPVPMPDGLSEYRDYSQGPDMKPNGLWFSPVGVDDNWHQYAIRHPEYLQGRVDYRFVFELQTDDVKIISTNEELRAFGTEYRWAEEADFFFRRLNMALVKDRVMFLDWEKVAKDFKGVVISPYQWSSRLSDQAWYYTWDCASGCVWDMDLIRNFRKE